MSTTGSTTRTSTATSSSHTLAGTGTLLRFMLRRDRFKLPVWVLGLALFMLYLTSALPAAYGTDEELSQAVQLFNDPVSRLMIGPGYGFTEPSTEQFIANGYGLYFLILAALMSILLITRHTRLEEQTARTELVRASVVGRHAPLSAALILAVLTNLSAALAVLAVMLGVGQYSLGGSLLFVAGMAALGIAFAGLATFTVQLSEYSRTAAGLAGAGLGAAFIIRGGGDMAQVGGTWLSWLSPLGWGQQTAPFVLDRWWPLVLPLLFAALGTAAGYFLSARRDVGSSPLAVRPGRAAAAPWLGTSLGLAWRLQRANFIGWTVSLGVANLAFGAFVEALLAADVPDVFADFFSSNDLLNGYLGFMALFMAYLVAAYSVTAIQGLRGEECAGRLEPVLATAVSKRGWLGANLAITGTATVVMLLVVGAAAGAGAALVTGNLFHVWQLAVAHLTHAPAVLVVLGLAVLLFGLVPRAVSLAWVVIGYALFVGTFGKLLELPATLLKVSPFAHLAQLPAEHFSFGPVLVLLAIAVLCAGMGVLAFRRRDITSN